MKRIVRLLPALLTVVLFLLSCNRKSVVSYIPGKTPLVEVYGSVLYAEELLQVIPVGVSESDSALLADRYIKNWIQDELFYRTATRNISDSREIDRMVESYRRSLIEHEYQKRLIAQKFQDEVTEEQVLQYYESNMNLFRLEEPIVKGFFLKVSKKAQNLDRIRKIYTQADDATFEEIEKFSVRNSARCDYFYDSWRNLSDLEILMPQTDKTLEQRLSQSMNFELKDDEYIYLVNISEYRKKGEADPLDHADSKIRLLLRNSNEVSYMRNIKEDLYSSALEKGLIIDHQIE